MIGVVVPAHQEEHHIGACLRAVFIAAQCAQLAAEPVLVIVVTDACTDRTAAIARSMGAVTVAVDARNVGIARARGAEVALAAGARWLAFTDADTVVAPTWVSAQLAQDSDAVCGTIAVHDWGSYGAVMRQHFADTYTDADGHRHIHGANLGVSAAAYLGAGGFMPIASGEDVHLVESLQRNGASIAWTAAPRVVTSARRGYRAPQGFGATLERVEHTRLTAAAGAAA